MDDRDPRRESPHAAFRLPVCVPRRGGSNFGTEADQRRDQSQRCSLRLRVDPCTTAAFVFGNLSSSPRVMPQGTLHGLTWRVHLRLAVRQQRGGRSQGGAGLGGTHRIASRTAGQPTIPIYPYPWRIKTWDCGPCFSRLTMPCYSTRKKRALSGTLLGRSRRGLGTWEGCAATRPHMASWASGSQPDLSFTARRALSSHDGMTQSSFQCSTSDDPFVGSRFRIASLTTACFMRHCSATQSARHFRHAASSHAPNCHLFFDVSQHRCRISCTGGSSDELHHGLSRGMKDGGGWEARSCFYIWHCGLRWP